MRQLRILVVAAAMLGMGFLYFNCSGPGTTVVVESQSTQTINSSTSSVVAVAMASALKNSAMPGNQCPTLATSGPETGCQNDTVDTNAVDLIYEDCQTSIPPGVWNGVLRLNTATGVAIHCGSNLSLTNDTLQKQFVDESGLPSSGSLVMNVGALSVDHAASGGTLINFDGVTILPTIGTGYGTSIGFDGGGSPNSVSINEHLWFQSNDNLTAFDETIVGTIGVSGNMVTSSNISVYHNVLQIIGVTTMNNVTFDSSCCGPKTGTLTTTYHAGANVTPTLEGAGYVGKSETLQVTACGAGTFTDISGHASNVTLGCF